MTDQAPPPAAVLPPIKSSTMDVRAIGMIAKRKRDKEIIAERQQQGLPTLRPNDSLFEAPGDGGQAPAPVTHAPATPVAALPGVRKPVQEAAPQQPAAPAPSNKMSLRALAESRGVKLPPAGEPAKNEGATAREVMENLEHGDGWSPAAVLKRPDIAANTKKATGAGLAAGILGLGRLTPKRDA